MDVKQYNKVSVESLQYLSTILKIFRSYRFYADFTIEMIGNETGPLLECVVFIKKFINKCETLLMHSTDNVACLLKILCNHFNSVNRCHKTNMTDLVLSL